MRHKNTLCNTYGRYCKHPRDHGKLQWEFFLAITCTSWKILSRSYTPVVSSSCDSTIASSPSGRCSLVPKRPPRASKIVSLLLLCSLFLDPSFASLKRLARTSQHRIIKRQLSVGLNKGTDREVLPSSSSPSGHNLSRISAQKGSRGSFFSPPISTAQVEPQQ